MAPDSDNPVVKLCVEGIAAEQSGRVEQALDCYTRAWEGHGTDFEACIAAHYLARLQDSPDQGLYWNSEALRRAGRCDSALVGEFYASLYLNLGLSYELLDRNAQALDCYRSARRHVAWIGDGAYAEVVREAIERRLEGLGDAAE